MPQRIGGYRTHWDVVGGNPITTPPPVRTNITVTGDSMVPAAFEPAIEIARNRNATRLYTPAELNRFYQRLHPIRHSVALRRQRMLREREIEEAIENQRTAFHQRASLMRHAGRERNSEEVRQRALTDWARWDPLAQFSERSERIFQEAMNREMNDLADQIGRLNLTPNPNILLEIDRAGNMYDVELVD